MKRRVLVLWALLVFALPAWSVDIAGVKLDDKANVGGQDLVLNGAGIRSRAIFKVYVASLYLPAKAIDLAGVLTRSPRRVQMNLLRDVGADQFVGALNDALKDNHSEGELAAIRAQADQMTSIMKGFGEVKEGHVVTLDFVDGGTRIGLNGAARGTIAGEAFNKALLRVWLGDRPVQPDLKKQLLGG
jgi:long-chain acyl-CoA synthetase